MSEKIIWRLEINCTDPNVIGNTKREKELIKKFDDVYKLLVKSFRMTTSYRNKSITINRKVIKGGD